MKLLAVTGLATESKIINLPKNQLVVGLNLEERIEQAIIREQPTHLLSWGIAGGLVAYLFPGDIVIGRNVIIDRKWYTCDTTWTNSILRTIRAPKKLMPFHSNVAYSDIVVTNPVNKTNLHRDLNTSIVDMESGIVGKLASKYKIPFAVVRTVCDPLNSMISPIALLAIKSDGKIDVRNVLKSLYNDPSQISDLIRMYRESNKAFASLRYIRRLFDNDFCTQPNL
jgi:adenosylhomocysteine nucleosidase